VKNRKSFFVMTPVVPVTFFIILCLAFWVAGWKLTHARSFRITRIVSRDADTADLSHLKGRNIFTVNLKEEARRLSQEYPAYRKVRLIRIFPDRIYIDLIKRRPVAYVKLYRYFCVDDERVLFNVPQEMEEPDLPVITGLEKSIPVAHTGARHNVRELAFALGILRSARQHQFFRDYGIKRIDVSGGVNASLYLAGGVEAKIGPDNLREKMAVLINILQGSGSDLEKIKYVDLRFKEPVLKLKDAK